MLSDLVAAPEPIAEILTASFCRHTFARQHAPKYGPLMGGAQKTVELMRQPRQ
jgi:hypothetical protein